MSDKKEIIIEVIDGSEGPCLIIDGYRVAGPKPWGGGRVVNTFKVGIVHFKAAFLDRFTIKEKP